MSIEIEYRKERLTFGKYKGKMIANIEIIDPDYLKWLSTDTYRYSLSDYWRTRIENTYINKENLIQATYMSRI